MAAICSWLVRTLDELIDETIPAFSRFTHQRGFYCHQNTQPKDERGLRPKVHCLIGNNSQLATKKRRLAAKAYRTAIGPQFSSSLIYVIGDDVEMKVYVFNIYNKIIACNIR